MAINVTLFSPAHQVSASVDSSIMDPFKITATSEQKQETRSAMNNLVDDMSFNSSIHFDSSPNKSIRRHMDMDTSQQLAHTSSIEATVLMVSNTIFV